MRISRLLVHSCLLALIGACGGSQDLGSNSKTAPDAADPADAAPCTSNFVSGELVDLDSTATALAGVGNATFTERGGSATDVTSSTGEFSICMALASAYVFDVDLSADRIDGFAFIEHDALAGIVPLSLRSMTTARATSFYNDQGLQFDATKAHVLVQLTGDISDVTLDRAHGTTQAASSASGTLTWSAGQVGRYVLFPNVDVANPTGQLSGDPVGPHVIPLAAGKLTLVAINFIFI